MSLSSRTLKLLEQRNLDHDTYDWVCAEIEGLQAQFSNPNWGGDVPHTMRQTGYLAGLMDLEREDRIEVLSMITGIELYWDPSHELPGAQPNVAGESSKDLRISKWMGSCLIEYYLSGRGKELNERLGYISKSFNGAQKRIARLLAKNKAASTVSP